jgi:hypothetical protein
MSPEAEAKRQEGAADFGSDPRTSGRPARRWAFRIAQLVLTGVVCWYILDRVGISYAEARGLDARWWTPMPGRLTVASLTLLGAYVLSSLLWRGMVLELGGPRLTVLSAVGVYLAANLGRYVPGKIWQILGLAYLSGGRGVPASIATSAAVLGQLAAIAGASLVGVSALWTVEWAGRGWALGGGALLVLGILVASSRAVMTWGLQLWGRLFKGAAPATPARSFMLRWTALYALNWLVYAVSFWLFVRSFGVDGGFWALGPAFAAAYVLGYLFLPAPAGIGVRESFLVTFTQPVLGIGAVAVAVLSRLWLTAVEVVPALALGARELWRSPSGVDR